MNPVLVDWLSVLLGPVLLVSAVVARRGVSREYTTGQPRSEATSKALAVMVGCALLMVVIHVV
ncbi:hypothetical protein [Streptomyces sp. 7-21]|uniref:hypothetical protein n=1 Tax=Streptomyces sp. 7-21 TaxID=2802283 RepID=UPI00191E5ABC|nr:hypothetical protein [Streptomyces sp. 7-21]MBL1066574.1 hypothetical protein [Streptomyces sp. 7-21]